MAVEIFRKKSFDSISVSTETTESVLVGVLVDTAGKLTFSGGTQGNAVIVADPPTLILSAASAPGATRIFQVTFQIQTSGWEYPENGALRLLIGNDDAGLQVPRDTPKEVTVLFYNGLKGKQKDLGSFLLGIQPETTGMVAAEVELQPVWHDPSILWEPPQG